MVNGKATLIVDLGNSETRVETRFGKTSKGNVRKRLSFLSNRFGEVPAPKVINYTGEGSSYTEDTSRLFNFRGNVYCNGAVCDAEFSSTAIRPTALEKKYESLLTDLTLRNVLTRGYEDIAAFTNSDLESIDVEWDLVLLLPPDDIDIGAKKLAEKAKSIQEIDFLMPVLQKEIKVERVNIFPEGFAALIGVAFEGKGVIRKGYEYLLSPEQNTLIVDIGAGTTDFLLSKGTNIVSTSRFTREIGGNNVHQRVRRLLKDQGLALSDSIVKAGCETGFVKDGSKDYNIIQFIAKAKADVSKQLVDAIQEFFEDNMMPIRSINNILVVGGGSEVSENEEILPISKYLIEYMQRLSPSINLVELPDIEFPQKDEDFEEDATEVKYSVTRLLNIVGAGILAA